MSGPAQTQQTLQAGPDRSPGATFAAAHDGVTRAGFFGATICLVLITCAYCYEVVARYFFAAPTTWADALVSYALCAMVFLTLPDLTRKRAHIVLTLLLERLSPSAAASLQRATRLAAALACLCAGWFSADASFNEFQQGIETMSSWPIPKWPLSLVIAYGMFSSSIYFFRQAASDNRDEASTEAVA
jgi:C4-dicarboxylate transporter DctQ subunit